MPVKGRAAPRRLEAEHGSRSCKEPIPASPVVSLTGLPLLGISSHGYICLQTSAQPHYISQEDNNRGTGKAWGHHRHCQGGILVLLLGAHSLSPQEDPKQGHFRLRGKENRDSSHNPQPLENSSETVQQQQQGKAHQGRPRSRRPGIAGGLHRWSGPCPARPGTGTEPQTHLRPPGCFPADPGDRETEEVTISCSPKCRAQGRNRTGTPEGLSPLRGDPAVGAS